MGTIYGVRLWEGSGEVLRITKTGMLPASNFEATSTLKAPINFSDA